MLRSLVARVKQYYTGLDSNNQPWMYARNAGVPTDAPVSVTQTDDGLGHRCGVTDCGRSFGTVRGLSQHARKAHPVVHDANSLRLLRGFARYGH